MLVKEEGILKWWRYFISRETWFSPGIENSLIEIGIPPTNWLEIEEIERICKKYGLFYNLPEKPITPTSYKGRITKTKVPSGQKYKGHCMTYLFGISYVLLPRIVKGKFKTTIRIAYRGLFLKPGHGYFYNGRDTFAVEVAKTISGQFEPPFLDDMPKVVEMPIPPWAKPHHNQRAFCIVGEYDKLIQLHYKQLIQVKRSI